MMGSATPFCLLPFVLIVTFCQSEGLRMLLFLLLYLHLLAECTYAFVCVHAGILKICYITQP